jgi:hypothetical protein
MTALRGVAAALLSVGVVVGCSAQPTTTYLCGRACEATERCDATLAKCVLNTAPAVTFSEPLPDALVTSPQFTIAGQFQDDANEFLEPQLSLDDGATWRPLPTDPDGTFTQQLDAPLADGQAFTATVKVKDSLGLEGRATRHYFVDRVAPRCRIVSPTLAQVLPGTSAQVTVEVLDGSQRYGQAGVSLDNGTNWQTAPVVDGQVVFTVPLPTLNGVTRMVQVYAEDAVGTRCHVAVQVAVDNVAPMLTLEAPTSGQALNQQDAGVRRSLWRQ